MLINACVNIPVRSSLHKWI